MLPSENYGVYQTMDVLLYLACPGEIMCFVLNYVLFVAGLSGWNSLSDSWTSSCQQRNFLLTYLLCFLFRCKSLILLETYTSNRAADFEVPPFLDVLCEVTGDLNYSMYNLSKKLDPELPMPSTSNDSATVATKADVEESVASELDTKVDGSNGHSSTSSVLDQATEKLADEHTTLDSSSKVVGSLPNRVKNGYHCDVSRDQVAELARIKADITAIIHDNLAANGHAFFGDVDDYERFASWCHGSKSFTAIK